MDPFSNILQEVHHFVLQHLDVREVLGASEVSKQWSDCIGSSQVCMKKIKFVVKFQTIWISQQQPKQLTKRLGQTDEIIKLFQGIKRNYKNVEVDFKFDRTLSIAFGEFLKEAGQFVTNLKVKNISEQLPVLQYPKLEVLKLSGVPTSVRDDYLSNTSSLKKLILKADLPRSMPSRASNLDKDPLVCLQHFIKTNHSLVELEIHGAAHYVTFFKSDLSKAVNFRLNTLKVKNGMRLAHISEEYEKNLISFLATQSSSLKSVFIDVCRPAVIQHAFNKLPALTSLHLDVMFMISYEVKELKLHLNQRIVDLKISYISKESDIKEFLSLTPNLSSLFVGNLSHATTEYIARNMQHLEILKYRYDKLDCQAFYDELKLDFPEVNQHIHMIIDYQYK